MGKVENKTYRYLFHNAFPYSLILMIKPLRYRSHDIAVVSDRASIRSDL